LSAHCFIAQGWLFLFAFLAHAQDSRFQFDATGNFVVEASLMPGPPVILSQPQMQVVAPGESASFFVLPADPRGLTYQWRFYGTNLAAASSDVLSFTNASFATEGPYTVVLSNSYGSVTSAPAMLWIDTDDDGLPDTWEMTYFGNLNQTATGDFNHNGVSNLDEFLNGTNPTNAVTGVFTLTVGHDGGSVLAMPSQDSYTNGQVVTLTATAIAPDSFHGWTGDALTRSNTITLVMTNNKAVYAHFSPIYFVWTNTVGGDWQVAANWQPNLVPASNDNVTIITTATITLNSDAACADFTFGAPNIAPTLTGSATLTIYGNATWTAGGMGGSGRTVLETGSTLTIANPGPVGLTSRTLENGGTVAWTGTGDFALSGGVVFTNRAGGIFIVQNQASFQSGPGPSPRIDNAGIFRKSGAPGTTSFGFAGYPVPFNNYGTVDIQSGGLAFNTGSNNGVITVPFNTTLSLGGFSFIGGAGSSITGAGDFTVNDGATSLDGLFNISGTVTIASGTAAFIGNVICTNNALNFPAGTATFSGAGTIAPAVVNLNGGTLDGAMDVTVGNSMSWTAGAMTGTGRTIIPPGVTLSLANSSTAILAKRTLENGGTLNWTGTGDLAGSAGAVITNRSGALLNVQNSATFQGAPGISPRLDNAGTFRKSVSSGATTFGFGFGLNNYALVDIQTGTLAPVSGGFNAGSIQVGAGTLLNLANFGSSAGSSITGAGAFMVSGNVSTLDGLFNVSGTHTINGTVTFIGTIFCTNNTVNIPVPSGSVAYSGAGTVTPAVVSLAGTLDGTMDVTVGSSMSWTSGAMTGSGRTIIPPGVTLSLANSSTVSLAKRILENGGTINWTGAGNLAGSAGAVITNRSGALLNVQNSATFQGAPDISPRLDNAGTFRKSVSGGVTTFGFGFGLNNYALVDIQTGTLAPVSGGFNAGSIQVGPGTLLNLANFGSSAGSSITGAGDLTISGNSATLDGLCNVTGTHTITGGPVTFIGTIFCTNNTLNIPSGSVAYGGVGTVSPSVLNLTGGTLDGSMVVTVGNTMTWTSGAMTGSGRTVILPGSTLTMANSSTVYLGARTLENAGTVVWTGTADFDPSAGAVITNRPGALFSIQSTGNMVGAPGTPPRIDNAGTLRRSGNTGTTSLNFGVGLNNYGTLEILNGFLAVNSGYFPSSDSRLTCAIGGTTPGTGYGQLHGGGGTITVNGSLNVIFTSGYVPATNDTFTVVTDGARSGAFTGFSYPSNQVTMVLSNTANSVIARVTGVIPPPPTLTIQLALPSAVRLVWPTNQARSFSLQSTTNLTLSPWSLESSAPVLVDGNNLVTNAILNSVKYYRLVSP
jgi:uncharacterized repeat protein (TIGR02543 family)